MTLGVGNIVALICIVISIIFAIVTHQATNALWWALLAYAGNSSKQTALLKWLSVRGGGVLSEIPCISRISGNDR